MGSLKINITIGKNTLLVVGVLAVLVISYQVFAAEVNQKLPWHPLQQISKSPTDLTSIDEDGDGKVDHTNANLSEITSNGAVTSNPITVGGLTTTGSATIGGDLNVLGNFELSKLIITNYQEDNSPLIIKQRVVKKHSSMFIEDIKDPDRRNIEIRYIKQTSDGGYIATGHLSSYKLVVIKFDKNGDVIWSKKGERGSGLFVYETHDEKYIVVSTGNNILCLSKSGELIWAKEVSLPQVQLSGPFYQTSDDGFIASLNGQDALIKFNSEGDIEWRIIQGQYYKDEITSIKQTSDGGYIMTLIGAHDKAISVHDMGWGCNRLKIRGHSLIIKLNSEGRVIWERLVSLGKCYLNGPGYRLTSIQQTDDGGYLVVGEVHLGLNGYEGAILKLDTSGDIVGVTVIPGVHFTDIQRTSNGDYVLSGTNSQNQYIIVKINSSLSIQWSKKIEGYGGLAPLQPTDDGGIVTAFSSRIFKLDSSGKSEECSSYIKNIFLREEYSYPPIPPLLFDEIKFASSYPGSTNSVSYTLQPIHLTNTKLCSVNERVESTTYLDTPLAISSNGNVAIGAENPGQYRLYVNGPAFSTSGWQSSDIRLKNILSTNLSNQVDKLLQLTPFEFKWKTKEYPEKGLPEGKHFGLSAQEVEKYFPELVKEDNEGYKAIAYIEFIPLLLEGMKQQQAEIQRLHMIIEKQEKKIEKLMKRRKSCLISSP